MVGASGQGLFLYDPDSNTFHQKLSPSDSNSLLQVRAIKEWRPGELMLASDQGLTCYDVKSGESELVELIQAGSIVSATTIFKAFSWIGKAPFGSGHISGSKLCRAFTGNVSALL